ncbi:MAG: neutral/alkaline non-lysosomal ceramidase N-terminal domain-containing protein [Lachnospiraceae bacterium]|nr:neutral/alkaline non-lysosomal ceramidase N-terminal domain-containing protein [Lachnospiraceae bacterium]
MGSEKTMLCGYARTDITPDFPVPLASYGNELKRISTGVLNPLFFTAVALTDPAGQDMLLMSYDISQANQHFTTMLKDYVQEAYGLGPEFVHLSGTHTHASVSTNWWLEGWEEVLQGYLKTLFEKAKKTIAEALADRKPAKMFYGETETEGLNFVRHYVDKTTTPWTSIGDNFGDWDKTHPIEHRKKADPTMRLIRFARTEENDDPAKDVFLVNWQAHNHISSSGKTTLIAADWSGAFRDAMEERKNCLFAFFQGCAGNLNPKSRIAEENRTLDYAEYGGFLADYATAVYDSLTEAKDLKIRSIRREFTFPSNKAPEELVRHAEEVRKFWRENSMSSKAAKEFAKPFGISSIFHANAIVRSQNYEENQTVFINAYAIGEVGWTTCPDEMFDRTGEEIRAASPFKMTFTQGYTDGVAGYLPYAEAYDYGCYEACTTRFAKGAAEAMRDQLIGMLKELHQEG